MKSIVNKFFLIFLILISSTLFSCDSIGVNKSVNNDESTLANKEDSINKVENSLSENQDATYERTILFYIIGSDLEENSMSATECIAEICKFKNPESVNYIFMTGGSLAENINQTREDEYFKSLYSEYYKINWEINQIWEARNGLRVVEENFGKENMTDVKTLKKFLEYVKKNYPSKKYDIIFSDHGGAGLHSFGTDTRYIEDGGAVTLRDLDDAFGSTGMQFDMVGFDACLMASFELMNVLSPYANYLVAAEETSFGDWDYSFLDLVNNDPGIDARELGIRIVDGFMDKANILANSLGVYSLRGFRDEVSESLTAFAHNMNEYLSTDNYLINLYDILRMTMGLGYSDISDVKDLRDFLDWVENLDDSELKTELKVSARNLWEDVEKFVIYYRTHKPKNEDGSEKTGGVNFVFPIENVYYSDGDEYDNAILSIENYPESLNEEYRLMYRFAFLRKSLVQELVYNTFENDDGEVIASLNTLCDRAREKYKIPKSYIDNIKDNIVPMLAGNRLRSGDDGNINFIRNVNDNKISFDLKFNEDIAWLLYTPNATARTYGIDGKVLSLGQVPVPRVETRANGVINWSITPEEDRWFKINSGDVEYLVEFILTDYDDENENKTLNYLFDRPVKGFIPGVLQRYENDDPEDNVIQIHVEFDGKNSDARIIGFTRYDQISNMSAKDLEEFKPDDSILLIANFENFNTNKTISFISDDEIPTRGLKVSRGYLEYQSVYFAYNAEDIYGGKYDFDVTNSFAFEIPGDENLCFYATFPSTWGDAYVNNTDSSIQTNSYIGKHTESIKINIYDVTEDTKNFGDAHINEEFSDTTVDYFISDDLFDEIYDSINGAIPYQSNTSLPIFNIIGSDKDDNLISKKYVLCEMGDEKYLIEASSTIASNSKNNATYHDMRLIRTIQELVNNIYEKDEEVVTAPITKK